MGYKSLVDGPGNTHYRKLAEWNPEAKVSYITAIFITCLRLAGA